MRAFHDFALRALLPVPSPGSKHDAIRRDRKSRRDGRPETRATPASMTKSVLCRTMKGCGCRDDGDGAIEGDVGSRRPFSQRSHRCRDDRRQPCVRASAGYTQSPNDGPRYRIDDLLSVVVNIVLRLLLASLLFRPAAAVAVSFDNCLPESYQYNNPTPLQWVPLYVDAMFDTVDPAHRLTVTMWGNVTGVYTNVTLPPPNSTEWTNSSFTNGKILEEPEPNVQNPKLTTLHSKVDVLTYEPFNTNTNFCNTSLTNASCPLAPIFNTSGLLIPYDLPSVTLANDFFSTYAFTSFSATFLIIYGDTAGTNIGCVSATITPDLGGLGWMLKFLPLIVLLFVGFANSFAGVFSPWGTMDIFHWTSNYGRDPDLLRLVTPGFGDCLQYIQFVALTGGLSLDYPGFYQPIVSQASWSALMFNESFVSTEPGWRSVQDGIYVTNATYGMQRLGQLVGIGNVEDIWAGMMVWLLVIIAAMIALVQAGFLTQWIYRRVQNIPEEDFRAKNIPFTLGNVVRIVINYFLFPIIALSMFQFVVAAQSAAYTVALAGVTIVLIMGFGGWLIYLIVSTKPRAFLFDDLPTLLLYGPLYNTYSDDAATFALVPVFCTFLRGIAVGAVQSSGTAQLVMLAIGEVIQILTLHAFRPFHSPTSMNAYHTLFSALRFVTVLLMIAFVPSLGVTEGSKGWIGYAILLCHAAVLLFGFFLNALQTIVEVVARMMGAGGDDIQGQSRGGLSKIFGMRQLSRRMSRQRNVGPSRQSQLSSSAMLQDADEASKSSGYIMPSGRVRSGSAGSIGMLIHSRQKSSSALDNMSLDAVMRGAGSFTPTTPGGEASVFSFLPSAGANTRQAASSVTVAATDPYYRPPRARRTTASESLPSVVERHRGSWTSGDWTPKPLSQAGGPYIDSPELERPPSSAAAPAPYAPVTIPFVPRTDYSTREVDFYYGVRGERLNSDAPSRKLGTGPADPTGPMASAASWLRNILGGKSKDKGKGFEVVRSARMPPAMRARGGEFGDDAPPEGIPVAMGVLRNGPIDSDDDDDDDGDDQQAKKKAPEMEPLDEDVCPQEGDGEEGEMSKVSDVPPLLPDVDAGDNIQLPSRVRSKASRHTVGSIGNAAGDDLPSRAPELPRKSSKRTPDHSRNPSMNPSELVTENNATGASSGTLLGVPASDGQTSLAPSRLPFERSDSQKRLSGSTEEFSQIDPQDTGASEEERPTNFGFVHQGSVNRVEDNAVDLLGSSAEVVDEEK